jgi:hypothetical protein
MEVRQMAEARSIDRLFEAHARAAELRRMFGPQSFEYMTALDEVAAIRRQREDERVAVR